MCFLFTSDTILFSLNAWNGEQNLSFGEQKLPTFNSKTRGVHRTWNVYRIECSCNCQGISADINAHRTRAIVHTVFVYGRIKGVGVTNIRIRLSNYETEEVGPNIMNDRK